MISTTFSLTILLGLGSQATPQGKAGPSAAVRDQLPLTTISAGKLRDYVEEWKWSWKRKPDDNLLRGGSSLGRCDLLATIDGMEVTFDVGLDSSAYVGLGTSCIVPKSRDFDAIVAKLQIGNVNKEFSVNERFTAWLESVGAIEEYFPYNDRNIYAVRYLNLGKAKCNVGMFRRDVIGFVGRVKAISKQVDHKLLIPTRAPGKI